MTTQQILTKGELLKQAGYFLITISLIVSTTLLMLPQFHVPPLTLYGYLLLGLGVVLLAVGKGREIIQHSRLRKVPVRCPRCGWIGSGEDWFRLECCPDCDSKEVSLMQT